MKRILLATALSLPAAVPAYAQIASTGAALPLTGGTMTGSLTISNGTGSVLSASGGAAFLTGATGGVATNASPLGMTAVGTNQNFSILGTGTGLVLLRNANGIGFEALDAGGTVANQIRVQGATTTNAPSVQAGGTDTNIDLLLKPQGTGIVRTPATATLRAGKLSSRSDLNGGTTWSSGTAVEGTANFISTGAVSGTVSASGIGSANYIGISTTNVDASSSSLNTFQGLHVAQNFGGTSMKGGIHGLLVQVAQTAATANSNGSTYTSGNFWMDASFNDGGSGLALGQTAGQLYSINPKTVLHTGATNWSGVFGGEINFGIQTGASAGTKIGLQIVNLSDDAVAGSLEDASLRIGSQNGAIGVQKGINFGGVSAWFPISSTGSIIATTTQVAYGGTGRSAVFRPPQVFAGVDFLPINFSLGSGFAFRSPAFSVDGTGQIVSANATLATTATGVKLDIPNQIVTAVAVSSAGSASGNGVGSYFPGDILIGPSAGQFQVVTTKVIAATVANGGTGGTNGTQTVTGTTGTGTPFQASVTVAGGAITAVGSITVAGSYTVNPTAYAAEPVTGAGLSGAVLNLGMGVGTVAILVPGVSAAGAGTYANPVATTGGSGIGCTLTLTWSVRNTLNLNPSGNTLVGSGSALSLDATSGMLQIPTVAGTPSGSIGAAGQAAVVIDTTGSKIWVNWGSGWKSVVLS